jgi:hypothetical protein
MESLQLKEYCEAEFENVDKNGKDFTIGSGTN